MRKYQNIKIEQLLEMPSSQVQNWLKDVWSGKTQVEENFNWLGFAQLAALKARADDEPEEKPDIEWAKIATSVYDWLASKADPQSNNSFLLSSMNLRAYMIIRLGYIPSHPVLDQNRIISWFKDNLHLASEEAAKQAAKWKVLFATGLEAGADVSNLIPLRRIKNNLNVIKLLVDAGKITPDQELRNWLELREKLP